MKDIPPNTPEFSRVFPVDKLRDHPMDEHIEAKEKECAALTKRLNLVALKKLTADFNLSRVPAGEMVQVEGTFHATVVQNCVVTMEAFETEIVETFKSYFARPPKVDVAEVDVALEDEKAPEPIPANGEVDLGELAAQHLSLALDPYPRKPGAVFKPVLEGEEIIPEKRNPFAVLADFKKPKK